MRAIGYRSDHYLRFNENYELDEWVAISGYPSKATGTDMRYDKLKQAINNRSCPIGNRSPRP